MAVTEKTIQQEERQVKASYVTTIISITLVLFTLGFLGMVLLNARTLSRYIKENIGFEVVIKKGTKEADILRLQKIFDSKTYVKYTEYITKEEAAERLKKTLGDDFISFLGEDNNPLLPSLEVKFDADWTSPDSLKIIETNVLKNSIVKEVYYHKSLLNVINKNVKRIGFILIIISLVLTIISIALINNTIRLAVYAKRHIIKSMQLVGATNGFIRKPFVLKGMLHGAISAIFAILLLAATSAFLKENIPEINMLQDRNTTLILYLMVIITGVAISGISTWLAVTRYLKTGSDKLYG
jgi:cell division transport system permease protein